MANPTLYQGSRAAVEFGTVVSISNAPNLGTGGSETFLPITEILTVDFSGAKRTVLDTTNMNSVFTSGSVSSTYAEKLDTIADAGSVKLTMNRIPNDPGQLQLATAFALGGKWSFTVQLPPNKLVGQITTGDLYSFTSIITGGPEFTLDPQKVSVLSYSLDISGPLGFTAGN